MPEFERCWCLRRKRVEERVEPRKIFFQRRRQLKQQRAKLISESAGHAAELRGQVLTIRELRVVRDASRRFQRELERRWHLLRPSCQQLLRRHAVEGVIDFDGRK